MDLMTIFQAPMLFTRNGIARWHTYVNFQRSTQKRETHQCKEGKEVNNTGHTELSPLLISIKIDPNARKAANGKAAHN